MSESVGDSNKHKGGYVAAYYWVERVIQRYLRANIGLVMIGNDLRDER